MMLNYVKYGLSEEPAERLTERKATGSVESLQFTAVPSAITKSSIVNYNTIRDHDKKTVYRTQYVWTNIVLLATLHLAAIYGSTLKFQHFNGQVFAKIIVILSSLGTTGGAHRLWTHRSYKANFIAQCLLMFMATLSYQNSVYVWARDHRMHHKYSETDADPHNAKRGFFFSHMGWLMVRKHPEVLAKGHTIDMSDLRANPIVMFQHKYYYLLVFLITVIFPTFFAYYVLEASWEFSFFYVAIYRYIANIHLVWCINSVAHLYGSKPYDRNIGPTESGLMQILGLGEGFHNYHHTFPYDYKAAEFHNDTRNLTTLMIDGFAWLGWVTDRKTVSSAIIDAKVAKSGDGLREMGMFDPKFKIYRNIKTVLILGAFLIVA